MMSELLEYTEEVWQILPVSWGLCRGKWTNNSKLILLVLLLYP